jgi:hypothetical protein
VDLIHLATHRPAVVAATGLQKAATFERPALQMLPFQRKTENGSPGDFPLSVYRLLIM